MKSRLSSALLLTVLFVSACATSRTPLVIDSRLSAEDVDEVLVLPVIDARPEPFEQVQVARNVGDAMVRYLRERGYFTIAADGYNMRPTAPLDLRPSRRKTPGTSCSCRSRGSKPRASRRRTAG